MIHPDEPMLLLYAYGEAPETDAVELVEHLTSCDGCRRRVQAVERERLLADLAFERPMQAARPQLSWVAAALAAAAVLAGVLLVRGGRPAAGVGVRSVARWPVATEYVTGGPDLIALDSALTKLEQELSHAKP